jgi:hypothetical protein
MISPTLIVCLPPEDALLAADELVDALLPVAPAVGDVPELLDLDDELQAATTNPTHRSKAYTLRDRKPPMTLIHSPLAARMSGYSSELPDNTNCIYT